MITWRERIGELKRARFDYGIGYEKLMRILNITRERQRKPTCIKTSQLLLGDPILVKRYVIVLVTLTHANTLTGKDQTLSFSYLEKK